ncbi:unnamed protein product [Rotaria socialis]
MTESLTINANCSIRQSNFSLTEECRLVNDENFEELSIIWLDSDIFKTDDCLGMMSALRFIINDLHTFDDITECKNYISSIRTDEKILFIVSGQLGEKIIPDIYESPKIVSIYIFCRNKTKHETWSKEYKAKIQGVFNDKSLLYSKLISDVKVQLRNFLSISVLSENVKQKSIIDLNRQSVSFLWFQLLIGILIHLKQDENAKGEMVNACRKQYKGNSCRTEQIEKFSVEYKPDRAIEWYCKDSFVYRLLNRALRTENIDIIYKFRFFITDLHYGLSQLRWQCSNQPIEVYRAQQMSINEIKILEENQNGLISVNNFFSTSKSYMNAEGFVDSGTFNYPKVVFTIKIDNSIGNDQIFTTIEDLSNYDQEKEVLFTIGTVFRVVFVEQVTDTYWSVELSLDKKINVELKHLIDNFEEMIGEKPTVAHLGNALFFMGDYNRAEKYNRALLGQLPPKHDYILLVNINIGDAYLNRGDYPMASEFYDKALSIATDLQPNPHIYLALTYSSIGLLNDKLSKYDEGIECLTKARDIKLKYISSDSRDMICIYNNLAMTYRHKANYRNSLEYYKKILHIKSSFYGLDPTLASMYNNIALVYTELNDNDEALSNYMKALEIELKFLPSNHDKIGTTYNNIGLLYRNKLHYNEALSNYEKAREIFLNSLGKDHLNIASVDHNIGDIYYKIGQFDKAFDYFKEAIDIQSKLLSDNHVDLAKSFNSMAAIYCQKENYAEALDYCKKAHDIQTNCLPKNHPDLAATYINYGTINLKSNKYSEALKYYEDSLEIMLTLYKDDHCDLQSTYDAIGEIYLSIENYEKSIEYYEKALKIQLKMLPQTENEVRLTFSCLGSAYSKQGNYSESIKNFEKALQIRSKSENQLEIASIFSSMGFNYQNQRNYSEALRYYEKTIEIHSNLLTTFYRSQAVTNNNIGNVYFDQNKYPEALEYFKISLNMQMKYFETNYSDQIHIYYKIGHTYRKLKEYDNAIINYKKALEIQTNYLSLNDDKFAKTFYYIGYTFYEQENSANALDYFNKALEIQLKYTDIHSEDLSITYNNIAGVYLRDKKYDKAIFNANESMKYCPKNHELSIASYDIIGIIYLEQKQFHNALDAYSEKINIMKDISYENRLELSKTYHNIGMMHFYELNYDLALANFQQELDIE